MGARGTPEEIITNPKAVRVRLRLSYKGRSWGSIHIQLEMANEDGLEREMGTGQTAMHEA
jgi:hypothetical protein